jgi:predicted O-methyltransferase YrrM
MKTFLSYIKEHNVNLNIAKTKKYIDEHLFPIIHNCGELLEGNIFTLHKTSEYTDVFLNKTKNISYLVMNSNIKNILEIGFNSGFSSLLMLISNPRIKINCIDIGYHSYTLPCYKKIKETFGERIDIIIGDSTKVLEQINEKYDLIHIDGGHEDNIVINDIYHSLRMSKYGTTIIMDDYDFPNINYIWNMFIKINELKDLDTSQYHSLHQDIKKFIETNINFP